MNAWVWRVLPPLSSHPQPPTPSPDFSDFSFFLLGRWEPETTPRGEENFIQVETKRIEAYPHMDQMFRLTLPDVPIRLWPRVRE